MSVRFSFESIELGDLFRKGLPKVKGEERFKSVDKSINLVVDFVRKNRIQMALVAKQPLVIWLRLVHEMQRAGEKIELDPAVFDAFLSEERQRQANGTWLMLQYKNLETGKWRGRKVWRTKDLQLIGLTPLEVLFESFEGEMPYGVEWRARISPSSTEANAGIEEYEKRWGGVLQVLQEVLKTEVQSSDAVIKDMDDATEHPKYAALTSMEQITSKLVTQYEELQKYSEATVRRVLPALVKGVSGRPVKPLS